MFYSHEILTSPEHGVATIWLVATLGSRSITRRFNRKAIFDVDVPEACRVIVNPDAPMALRLQGNLLYGVSRVYHQQCGYTLLDVQAMHDKMVTKLKLLPGGGLDPIAGKTKPSTLVLPYDPSFLPETGLPGINFDLAFDLSATDISSPPSILWTNSPTGSHSSTSQHIGSVQLELSSDDALVGVVLHLSPEDGTPRKRRIDDEEGVLLQPDFEFDEDGNIVEFDPSRLSPRKRRRTASPRPSQGPGDEMEHMEATKQYNLQNDNDLMDITMQADDQEVVAQEQQISIEEQPAPLRRRAHQQRVPKSLATDPSTTLRNTDLANQNADYLRNMAQARKQKQQNKQQTLTKKNAEFWVLGQGIGSVGVGLGAKRNTHPLSAFSGTALFQALCGETEATETSQLESPGPNKAQVSPGIGLGLTPGRADTADVEVGRDAPASLLDEHSSQMPWNISASLQSSRFRLGSVGEASARGESASLLARLRRGRLTSASPLAGRGYLEGSEQWGSVAGGEDELDAREIAAYLEGELATDHEDISILSRRVSMLGHAAAQLDREGANFLDFLTERMNEVKGDKVLRFADLLPPGSTSAVIATQGLMNVLTLANEGLLRVKQEKSEDLGDGPWGKRYWYGHILMRLERGLGA